MNWKRRVVGILTIGAILLSGCSGGAKPESAAKPAEPKPAEQKAEAPKGDGQLVVSTFGFGADKVQQFIIEPFQKKYNVKVTVETGANADRLNKLKANKGNPNVDVILITDYFAQIGINEGLFEKIDANKIPNLKNLYDFALNKDGYGPVYTVNRLGIVYRTDLVKSEPTSWKDLWRPENKGMLALPDLNISYGMPFLGAVAKTFGKDDTDMEAAFKALKEVKPNVVKFFGKTSELTSLLQRGEVTMAPAGDIFVIPLVKEKQPVKWVVPKEGSYLISNTVQIVKGTKRLETAHQFIDFLLSKEVQEVAAKEWYDAPVNKEAKLDPETGKFLAYGNEAFQNFKVQDQAFVVKNRDAWLDRFMREIAQ
jgi:putative spermidine/putrescine transport system substrate-binding protein